MMHKLISEVKQVFVSLVFIQHLFLWREIPHLMLNVITSIIAEVSHCSRLQIATNRKAACRLYPVPWWMVSSVQQQVYWIMWLGILEQHNMEVYLCSSGICWCLTRTWRPESVNSGVTSASKAKIPKQTSEEWGCWA